MRRSWVFLFAVSGCAWGGMSGVSHKLAEEDAEDCGMRASSFDKSQCYMTIMSQESRDICKKQQEELGAYRHKTCLEAHPEIMQKENAAASPGQPYYPFNGRAGYLEWQRGAGSFHLEIVGDGTTLDAFLRMAFNRRATELCSGSYQGDPVIEHQPSGGTAKGDVTCSKQ